MNSVMREEKKYLMNQLDYTKMSAFLADTLTPDPHNGATGYQIRSLYFDTIDDKDYYDKVHGFEMRRKIRLRIYDTKADFAMLEMKQKEGAYQKKRSLRLSRAHAEQISQAQYTSLLQYPEPFATECYAVLHQEQYRPKCMIEYRRLAFLAKENRIRITIDSNIAATETSINLYDPKLPLISVFNPFHSVLEVKFNGFLLTYIKDVLQIANYSEISVSKYCLARSFTLGTI